VIVPSAWVSPPCSGTSARWRYLENGQIEIDGLGVPTRSLPPGVEQWRPKIVLYAAKYRVSPHQIAAEMAFESGGDPNARSPSNARGLMQLMPSTGAEWASRIGRPISSPDELFTNPDLNLEAGVAYLAYQMGRYKDFLLAATAYNAGSVKCMSDPKVAAKCTTGSFWDMCTDGSDYPLQVAKFANAAAVSGWPVSWVTVPAIVGGTGLLAFFASMAATYYVVTSLREHRPVWR
jgi:hypothetical protein